MHPEPGGVDTTPGGPTEPLPDTTRHYAESSAELGGRFLTVWRTALPSPWGHPRADLGRQSYRTPPIGVKRPDLVGYVSSGLSPVPGWAIHQFQDRRRRRHPHQR